jgi:hypothetical protein
MQLMPIHFPSDYKTVPDKRSVDYKMKTSDPTKMSLLLKRWMLWSVKQQ